MISTAYRFVSCAALLLIGTAAVGCSAERDPDLAEVGESAYGTCPGTPGNDHECSAWGATCNGTTLETCVVDSRGCRVKLVETCDLGCSAGACNTCRTLSEPKLGASLTDESAWYQAAVKKGSYVYATWNERNGQYAGDEYGLAVVDVSNPSAPVTTKVVKHAPGDWATRLTIAGTKLYVLQKERMQIYDVANPTAPVTLGSYAVTQTPSSYPPHARQRAVSVDGNIACVAADDGLHVVDVSTPSAPVKLGVLPSPSWRASNVVCKSGHAAMTAYDKIIVADIRTPTAPSIAAEATLGGHVYEFHGDLLRFDGSRAWVASSATRYEQSVGVREAFDFTPATSTMPASITRSTLRGDLPPMQSIDIDGNGLVFHTSSSVGLIDLSPSAGPTLVKHVVTGNVRGIAHEGAYVFASGADGIRTFDLSKAPDVRLESTTDYPSGTAMVGSIAYLARGKGGFVVQDMRDPKKPVVMAKVTGMATSLSVHGHRVYVTFADNGQVGGGDELRVYDVQSPWEPRLLGTYVERRSYIHTRTIDDVIAASSTRAYASCDGGQLCVFDVSGNAAPVQLGKAAGLVGQYVAYNNRSAFAASGNLVYLAKPDALTIADLTDVANPVVKGSLALGGYAGAGSENTRVLLGGANDETAYVLHDCFYTSPSGLRCLHIVDVSNPAAPTQLAELKFGARYETVDGWDHESLGALRLVGDRLYLTTKGGGIVVIDVSTSSAPKILGRMWTKAFANDVFVSGRFAAATIGQHFGAPSDYGWNQVIEICQP